jgi:hypothetical protein
MIISRLVDSRNLDSFGQIGGESSCRSVLRSLGIWGRIRGDSVVRVLAIFCWTNICYHLGVLTDG